MLLRRFIPLLMTTIIPAAPALAGERPAEPQGEVKIERGSRVDVTNSNGPVTITMGETVRIVARYTDSGNPASVNLEANNPGGAVEIRPSYRDRDESGEVSLDVQLPQTVTLNSVVADSGDLTVRNVGGDFRLTCHSGNVHVVGVGNVVIRADSGDVLVEGVNGSAFVELSSGNFTARGVKGELTVKAGSGDARVDDSGGMVDATLQSGNLTAKNITGPVRVAAISGDVVVNQSGPVQVQSASGNITLTGVKGDCEAKTASGNVVFTGEIAPDHTYRIKSMSGEAVMRLCGTVPGFTVALRSYSGEIETEFELKVERNVIVSRGLTGRYGDGRTQIQIEAFSGSAKILKCGSAAGVDE